MREVRLENEKYLTLLSKSCQLRRIAQLAYLSALIYSSLGMMLNGEHPFLSAQRHSTAKRHRYP